LLRAGLEPAPEPNPPEAFESHQVTIGYEPIHAGPVLEALAHSIGSIPRVLLPDTQTDDRGVPVIKPSSPEMPALAKRGNRYQLFGEIARGGMGAVLEGRDADLGRDLAVKVLLEAHSDKPDLLRRFVEEAQIGGQLQHPGIVPVYELGAFADRRPYFTMKLVKGRTLATLLGERGAGRGPPDPALRPSAGLHPARDDLLRSLAIFEQVAQTLAELAQVEAHARADEEAKRRVLSDQLAAEAHARAEEAGRRVAVERQRRRYQLALAASALVLTAVGGLSYTYLAHERQARAARAELALKEATLLRNQAVAAPEDVARWEAAAKGVEAAGNASEEGAVPNRPTAWWCCETRFRPGCSQPAATELCSTRWPM